MCHVNRNKLAIVKHMRIPLVSIDHNVQSPELLSRLLSTITTIEHKYKWPLAVRPAQVRQRESIPVEINYYDLVKL
jgi:hypothetical protein